MVFSRRTFNSELQASRRLLGFLAVVAGLGAFATIHWLGWLAFAFMLIASIIGAVAGGTATGYVVMQGIIDGNDEGKRTGTTTDELTVTLK